MAGTRALIHPLTQATGKYVALQMVDGAFACETWQLLHKLARRTIGLHKTCSMEGSTIEVNVETRRNAHEFGNHPSV